MYSFPNFEPVHCSISGSNCCFLSCYRFLRRQVRWSHISICFKNFPQFDVIHTVKGFSIVIEADFFYPVIPLLSLWSNRGWQLISGSSAFSKSKLYIWQFSVHELLKPSLKDFEHHFASMWNEWNCVVVWTFFGIALLWDGMTVLTYK